MQLCSVYINIDIYPYFDLCETSCHSSLFFLNEWFRLHNHLPALYCRERPEINVCVYVSGRWRNLRKDGFCCFTARQVFLVHEMVRWTRIRWMWRVAFMWEKINAYWVLARKPKEKRPLWLTWGIILKWILGIGKVWTLFGLITRPEESYQVWCVWVLSWSLDKEEGLTHYGLLRHKNGLKLSWLRIQWRIILHTVTKIFVPQGAGIFYSNCLT